MPFPSPWEESCFAKWSSNHRLDTSLMKSKWKVNKRKAVTLTIHTHTHQHKNRMIFFFIIMASRLHLFSLSSGKLQRIARVTLTNEKKMFLYNIQIISSLAEI